MSLCIYLCTCMYVYIYMIFQLIHSHSLDDLCSASFLDPLLYTALEGSHSSGLIPNLKLKFKDRPSILHLSTSCELMKTLSTLGSIYISIYLSIYLYIYLSYNIINYTCVVYFYSPSFVVPVNYMLL